MTDQGPDRLAISFLVNSTVSVTCWTASPDGRLGPGPTHRRKEQPPGVWRGRPEYATDRGAVTKEKASSPSARITSSPASSLPRPAVEGLTGKDSRPGPAGTAGGRQSAVNIGHLRHIDPQMNGGPVGLARVAGGPKFPYNEVSSPVGKHPTAWLCKRVRAEPTAER